MTKHLYIHIPLCKTICTFCDFKRELLCAHDPDKLVNYLIKKMKKFSHHQFKTIYIGGGTPNALSDKQLNFLLKNIKPYLNKNYEFTIECNPDLVTKTQVEILKQNKVNRISLGVQSTNNKILKILNRTHTIQTCIEAISLFRKSGFKNISVDFMYALPLMSINDVIEAVKFVKLQKVQHVSFYGLDLKPGAILTRQKYKINLDDESDQLELAIKEFDKIGFKRYEVSNWAESPKYQSRHNLAYWLTKDWSAIGYGACGFENRMYYEYVGTIKRPKKVQRKLSELEYYQQVLIMGLRLFKGINVNIQPYKKAYEMFKSKLNNVTLKNGFLFCNNINLLNNSIINII